MQEKHSYEMQFYVVTGAGAYTVILECKAFIWGIKMVVFAKDNAINFADVVVTGAGARLSEIWESLANRLSEHLNIPLSDVS